MSDDDRDIDVESDEGDDSDSRQPSARQSAGSQYYSQTSDISSNESMFVDQAEKRAHHNALERKRRDHIKDSFSSLRDSVPALNGEKVASRAQILKKAAEYIMFMRKKNHSHQQDIEDLKRQNTLLEGQIARSSSPDNHPVRVLEKNKTTGVYAVDSDGKDSHYNETESDTSDNEDAVQQRRPKKLKISAFH